MGEPKKWYAGFASLLVSRKVLIALIAVAQTVIFALIPEFPQEIWIAIDGLAVALIGAIAHEDAAEKRANTPVG